MALFYHGGALGDFLLSLPFLREARRCWPNDVWTLAAPEEHAALVSRLFPHAKRLSPGCEALAPLLVKPLDPDRLAALAGGHGGLFGFVPRAREVEAAVREARPGASCVLAEPLALAVAAGASIEEVLADAIRRATGLDADPVLAPEDFAISPEELPDPPRGMPSLPSPLALIHPGASDPAKVAPRSVYEGFATGLEARGLHVVWVRGPVERERGVEVLEPSLDAPDLVTLAHAIVAAAEYVGNDTGPTHLASALGVRTFAVHCRTNHAWRPRGRNAFLSHCALVP